MVAVKGGKMSYLWICPDLGLDIHEKLPFSAFFQKKKALLGYKMALKIGFDRFNPSIIVPAAGHLQIV
jgi:hypothetical protein